MMENEKQKALDALDHLEKGDRDGGHSEEYAIVSRFIERSTEYFYYKCSESYGYIGIWPTHNRDSF